MASNCSECQGCLVDGQCYTGRVSAEKCVNGRWGSVRQWCCKGCFRQGYSVAFDFLNEDERTEDERGECNPECALNEDSCVREGFTWNTAAVQGDDYYVATTTTTTTVAHPPSTNEADVTFFRQVHGRCAREIDNVKDCNTAAKWLAANEVDPPLSWRNDVQAEEHSWEGFPTGCILIEWKDDGAVEQYVASNAHNGAGRDCESNRWQCICATPPTTAA